MFLVFQPRKGTPHVTPLKRQKMEEITSPTPEKKTKTKEANDQQLTASPAKVLLRPSKLGAIGTETPRENTQDKSDLVDAENSPFARGAGEKFFCLLYQSLFFCYFQ